MFGDDPDDIQEVLHKGHDINVFNKYMSIEMLGLGKEFSSVASIPEPSRYSLASEEGKEYVQA